MPSSTAVYENFAFENRTASTRVLAPRSFECLRQLGFYVLNSLRHHSSQVRTAHTARNVAGRTLMTLQFVCAIKTKIVKYFRKVVTDGKVEFENLTSVKRLEQPDADVYDEKRSLNK